MRFRCLELFVILQLIDFAQHRPFPNFKPRLSQVGFRLGEIGRALRRIAAVLGGLLIGLMRKIVELGRGVSCRLCLCDAVEFRTVSPGFTRVPLAISIVSVTLPCC
jgi:hypothetical protein